MKDKLFNTAKQIQKYIIFETKTEYNEFYNIKFNKDKEKDIQVNLSNGIRGGIDFNCTCKWHSLVDAHMNKLCSYVLGVLLFRLKK